jgi:hypothetical protein
VNRNQESERALARTERFDLRSGNDAACDGLKGVSWYSS